MPRRREFFEYETPDKIGCNKRLIVRDGRQCPRVLQRFFRVAQPSRCDAIRSLPQCLQPALAPLHPGLRGCQCGSAATQFAGLAAQSSARAAAKQRDNDGNTRQQEQRHREDQAPILLQSRRVHGRTIPPDAAPTARRLQPAPREPQPDRASTSSAATRSPHARLGQACIPPQQSQFQRSTAAQR